MDFRYPHRKYTDISLRNNKQYENTKTKKATNINANHHRRSSSKLLMSSQQQHNDALKYLTNFLVSCINKRPTYQQCISSITFALVELRSDENREHIYGVLANAILKYPFHNHELHTCTKNVKSYEEKLNELGLSFVKVIGHTAPATHSGYNNLLLSKKFWNHFETEYVLIHQEDSLIFKDNLEDFTKFDYIGAAWDPKSPDAEALQHMHVGNGGLSLRKVSVILRAIDIIEAKGHDSVISSYYSGQNNRYKSLEQPPEDVVFVHSIQNNALGIVAPFTAGKAFSQEAVLSDNPFGGHRYWLTGRKTISLQSRRVGIFSNIEYLIGGGEKYLADMMRVLLDIGFEVYFFNPSDPNTVIETLKIFSLYDISKLTILSLDKINALTPGFFDIFILMQNVTLPIISGRISKRQWYHCQFPHDLDNVQNIENVKTLHSQWDRIIVNSSFTKKTYENIPLEVSFPVNILNPLITERCNYNKEAKDGSFLTIGRIFAPSERANNKCHDIIIDAAIKADCELTVVGSIVINHNTYAAKLKNIIKPYKNIKIITDASNNIKSKKIEKASYYVHATGLGCGDKIWQSEHFGIAILEAMAAGCIPIVVDVGYPVTYIKHGVNGFVFSSKDELTDIMNGIKTGNLSLPNIDEAIKQNFEIVKSYGYDNYKRQIACLLTA